MLNTVKGIFAFPHHGYINHDTIHHNVLLPSNRYADQPLPITIETGGTNLAFQQATTAELTGSFHINARKYVTLRAGGDEVDVLAGVDAGGRLVPRFTFVGSVRFVRFSTPLNYLMEVQTGPLAWEFVGVIGAVHEIPAWLRPNITVMVTAVYSFIDPLSRVPQFEAASLDLLAPMPLAVVTGPPHIVDWNHDHFDGAGGAGTISEDEEVHEVMNPGAAANVDPNLHVAEDHPVLNQAPGQQGNLQTTAGVFDDHGDVEFAEDVMEAPTHAVEAPDAAFVGEMVEMADS